MIICSSLLPLQRLVLGLGPLVATHLVHIELVEADHGTMDPGALGAAAGWVSGERLKMRPGSKSAHVRHWHYPTFGHRAPWPVESV